MYTRKYKYNLPFIIMITSRPKGLKMFEHFVATNTSAGVLRYPTYSCIIVHLKKNIDIHGTSTLETYIVRLSIY